MRVLSLLRVRDTRPTVQSPHSPASERFGPLRWAALGILGCLLMVVAHFWRDAGTYGHVFADERIYSYQSRLMPVATTPIPSYLYLLLFSTTKSCGEGWLTCARLLNALLFAAALPLIFFTARRFASLRLALLVTAITAVSPFSTFTAYFMPEATYFLGVWVLLWLLTVPRPQVRLYPLAVGAAMGLLALVKVHAFFLTPAVAAVVFWAGWRAARHDERLREGTLWVVVTAVTVLVMRFGGGWLFANDAGLNLLGGYYAQQAQTSALKTLVSGVWGPLWANIQALTVLFALPLAVLLSRAPISAAAPPGARLDDLRRLQVLVLLLLVPLVLMVALFTAEVAGGGPYETTHRVHLRYYSFLFPLLVMLVAARLDHPGRSAARPSRWSLLAPLALTGTALYAAITGMSRVTPGVADCPELLALGLAPNLFWVSVALGVASVILWAVHPRWGAQLYLLLALPLTVASTWVATGELRKTQELDVYATGATVTRSVLGIERVERLEVITPSLVGGYAAIFVLDNQMGSFITSPVGSEVAKPSPPREWVLLFGDYVPAAPHQVLVSGKGYTLIHFE